MSTVIEHKLLNLSEIRGLLQLTQQELADIAGITRQTYAKIESGNKARIWSINSIFEAIKAEYGDRFSKLEKLKSSEDEYIIIYEIKKNITENDICDNFWESDLNKLTFISMKALSMDEKTKKLFISDFNVLANFIKQSQINTNLHQEHK